MYLLKDEFDPIDVFESVMNKFGTKLFFQGQRVLSPTFRTIEEYGDLAKDYIETGDRREEFFEYFDYLEEFNPEDCPPDLKGFIKYFPSGKAKYILPDLVNKTEREISSGFDRLQYLAIEDNTPFIDLLGKDGGWGCFEGPDRHDKGGFFYMLLEGIEELTDLNSKIYNKLKKETVQELRRIGFSDSFREDF